MGSFVTGPTYQHHNFATSKVKDRRFIACKQDRSTKPFLDSLLFICLGEWSCWTEWSECSGSCASSNSIRSTGHRSRTRKCLSPEGCTDAAAALERRACVTNCAGTHSIYHFSNTTGLVISSY